MSIPAQDPAAEAVKEVGGSLHEVIRIFGSLWRDKDPRIRLFALLALTALGTLLVLLLLFTIGACLGKETLGYACLIVGFVMGVLLIGVLVFIMVRVDEAARAEALHRDLKAIEGAPLRPVEDVAT